MLAAFGHDGEVSDEESTRRYVGALLLVRGIRRLDQITQLLTAPATG
jgi:hypothetical protein